MKTPSINHTKTSNHLLRLILPSASLLFVSLSLAGTLAPVTFQWANTGNLNVGRSRQTANLLANGQVLIAGGITGGFANYITATAELYDPAAATWTRTGNLIQNRQLHTATLLHDGRVLIAGGGGLDANNDAFTLASAELYDATTGAFTGTGALTTARETHTATLLRDGRVLVAGGFNNIERASCEIYDPSTGVWSRTGDLNQPRYRATATLLRNGQVLVAGGSYSVSPFTRATCELYDPVTGTWSLTGSLSVGREGHTATLLRNGQVLAVGGLGFNGFLSSCELYDPTAGTWITTGSLPEKRAGHAATLLGNGQVIVAGGSSDPALLTDTPVYDPRSGIWNAGGSLVAGRSDNTATLLPDRDVLVVGGGIKALRSAELGTQVRPARP